MWVNGFGPWLPAIEALLNTCTTAAGPPPRDAGPSWAVCLKPMIWTTSSPFPQAVYLDRAEGGDQTVVTFAGYPKA
jgi:hypothetical protein